jgi:hypothetical protein
VVKPGEDLLISGAWIVGIGTVISALGQTKQSLTGSEMGKGLVVKGNDVEALGNSFQAIGRTKLIEAESDIHEVFSILGCWLQAGGNATNSVGVDMQIRDSEEMGLRINSLGSGVQSLGAVFEVTGVAAAELTLTSSLEILGTGLIAVGSLLDSIGEIFILKKRNQSGKQLLLLGSWTQVVGAFTSIYALSLETETVLTRETVRSKPYSSSNKT